MAVAISSLAVASACAREPERAFELEEGQQACVAAIQAAAGENQLVVSAGATIQSGTERYTPKYTDLKGNVFECQINRFKIADVRKNGQSILGDVPQELRAF
jgi:hypothetical protein